MADKFRIIHLSGDNAEEKAQTLLNGGTIETPDGGTGTMGENDIVAIPDKTDERLDDHEARIAAVESAVDGIAATVEIGTVTTGAPGSEVKVENVGTPTAAVLNFTIPQGENGVIRNLATGEEFNFFIGPTASWKAYTGDKTNVLFFPTDEKKLYEHEVSIKLSNTPAGYATNVVDAYLTFKFKSEKSGYTSYSNFITDFLAWAKERSVNDIDGYFFDAGGYLFSEATYGAGYYAVTCARYELHPTIFAVEVYGFNGNGKATVSLYEDTANVDSFHCHSTQIR